MSCTSTGPPIETGLARQDLATGLDHCDRAGSIGCEQPAADMKCRGAEHTAAFGDGELGGAAADVDIEHSALFLCRVRHSPGTMGGELRFEIVTGGGADEVTALCGEQIRDGPGVVPPDRFAGENDGSRVDVART